MKYLAFDGINCEYQPCETIEEAREWLEESFLDSAEGYHPELDSCKICKIHETVEYDIVAKKKDFTEEEWEDEGYLSEHDEIWQHKLTSSL